MMEKIVEVKNLCKNYGKEEILKNVSFDIYKKEIVGFIGPNGAGKSTTMKCMCNLIFPTSGSISICGYDITKESEKALSFQASQIESPGLYPDLTGLEHLKLFAGIRKISKERIEEIIVFMNLESSQLKKKTKYYSMGMKQRLALGIALLGKPKFIILDEPTNGLDPNAIIELRKTLRKLVEEDISILFSSHALGEIEKIADRIICINQGRIIPTPSILMDTYIYEIRLNPSIPIDNLLSLSYVLNASKVHDKYTVALQNKGDLQKLINYCNKELNAEIEDITKVHLDIESIYQKVYGV